MLKVSEHIDNCANTSNLKYFIFPFYKMYTDSPTLRRVKEKFFINTLRPKLPEPFSRDLCHQGIQTPETSLLYSITLLTKIRLLLGYFQYVFLKICL